MNGDGSSRHGPIGAGKCRVQTGLRFMRIFSTIAWYWEAVQFRRRWRAIYRNAVPIVLPQGIYLSIFEERGQDTARSIAQVWPKIPKSVRDELDAHWQKMQRSWDRRRTGIPLRIPIVAVGMRMETLKALGRLCGIAIRTTRQAGFQDSVDSVMRRFAGLFLYVWNDADPENEADQTGLAMAVAHYYLCMKNAANGAEFGLPFASDYRELAKQWGFIDERNDNDPGIES